MPSCRLVSLYVPQASTTTRGSSPLLFAAIAGKAAQTSRERPANRTCGSASIEEAVPADELAGPRYGSEQMRALDSER
jgi:hypothetical protein